MIGLDFHSRQTRTRFATFRRSFRRDLHSTFEQRVARLAVLYEDLRIEVLGVSAEQNDVPLLEAFGPQYRQQYFMRRAIATTVEFQQAVEQIARMPEFLKIELRARESNDVYYLRDWLPALNFFQSKRKLLKAIRNDVGGHFGEQAITNAFQGISDDYIVRVEIQFDINNRTRLLLPFASELAATALLRHLPGPTPEERAKALVDLLLQAVEYAVGVVHFFVAAFLWERMG